MYEIIKQAHDAKVLEARIVEWGRWMRVDSGCRIGTGPNLIYNLMREAGTVKSAPTPLIGDDEAELIGHAVMALKRAEPLMGEAIVNYYATRPITNLVTLAKDLKVSRTKAAELVNAGLGWLQGYFCCMWQVAA